jgi:anthranilate phosphoribosyltransferase
LEALGVKVDLTPKQVEECVSKCNIAFMFAPINHPSMKHVAPVRKKLGVRTVFNILGPMTNAAGAQHAVIGVFDAELIPLMAGALQEVGRVDHAVIIHGVGLDEISPLGPATILEVRCGDVLLNVLLRLWMLMGVFSSMRLGSCFLMMCFL